jgi:hypothetical protein
VLVEGDGAVCRTRSNNVSAASTQERIESPGSHTTPRRVSPLRRKKRAPPRSPFMTRRSCQPSSSWSRPRRSSRHSRRSSRQRSPSLSSRREPWACAAVAANASPTAIRTALRIRISPFVAQVSTWPSRSLSNPSQERSDVAQSHTRRRRITTSPSSSTYRRVIHVHRRSRSRLPNSKRKPEPRRESRSSQPPRPLSRSQSRSSRPLSQSRSPPR